MNNLVNSKFRNLIKNVNLIIISSQSTATTIALSEIQKTDPNAKLIKKLSFTEQLISIPMGYECFLESFKVNGSIFIRHMFPVVFIGQCGLDRIGELDSNELFNMFKDNLDKNFSFSIQKRGCKDNKEVYLKLENQLISDGFNFDYKSPEQIISVYTDYTDENTTYIGISLSSDNISIYNGGMHRFKMNKDIISRAEFKLLEALDDFGINLPQNGYALDLGASPGGFCRILLERGLYVTAVDPANLDKCLVGQKNLIHFKGLAEQFTGKDDYFDVITNDMKIDISESIIITGAMKRYLKQHGQVIMTLKLSDGNWLKKTNKAIIQLEKFYTVKKAKQLFNNRSEVTVLLCKNKK